MTQVANIIGAHAFRTIGQLLQWGKNELKILGSDESLLNTERIMEAVLGLNRSSVYLNQNQIISDSSIKRYQEMIAERKERKPLSYILGEHAFWDETLEINEFCLIPRPETEILIENFIRYSGFEKRDSFSFLDLCAGSGAIGIAILREFPNSEAVFSDISEPALKMVRKNLRRYDLSGRAKLCVSDLFQVWDGQSALWDAVLCNPPYLSYEDLEKVEVELQFEPVIALNGGEDGYDFYRKIAAEAPNFLKKDGRLFMELGIHQAQTVTELLNQSGKLSPIRLFKDYSRTDRVITARKN